MNNNYNTPPEWGNNNSSGWEPQEPWYRRPDVTVPKDYNPYKEEQSVFTEIYEENPHLFAGPDPLQFETPALYDERMRREKRTARMSAMAKLKKASGYVCAALLLFLIIREGLVSCIGLFSGEISDKAYTILTDIFLVLQYAAIAAVVIYLMTVGKKNKFYTYFRKPETSVAFTVRWTVIAFGLSHIVALVSNILFSLLESLGMHINDLSSPLPSGIAENILYFLAIVVCAPIFEELLFRGILLTPLSRFGSWFAIIATSILFGLYHMNHAQLFFAIAFGIVLGYVDMRSKSIIPSMIAHAVFNGYSYVAGLVASFTNYEEVLLDPTLELTGSTPALMLYGLLNGLAYAVMLGAIVLLIYELATNKEQFSLPKGDSGLTAGEKFSAFISHPLTITYLIIIFLYIILVSFVDMEAVASYIEQINEMYAGY